MRALHVDTMIGARDRFAPSRKHFPPAFARDPEKARAVTPLTARVFFWPTRRTDPAVPRNSART